MAKPEWGTKRQCLSCAAKFYDLGHSPIVCPSCGTVLDLETIARARRPRPSLRSGAGAGAGAGAAAVIADDPELVVGPGAAAQVSEDEVGDEEVEAVVADPAVEEDEEEDAPLIEDADDLVEDDIEDVIDDDIEDDPDAPR